MSSAYTIVSCSSLPVHAALSLRTYPLMHLSACELASPCLLSSCSTSISLRRLCPYVPVCPSPHLRERGNSMRSVGDSFRTNVGVCMNPRTVLINECIGPREKYMCQRICKVANLFPQSGLHTCTVWSVINVTIAIRHVWTTRTEMTM